MNRLQRLEARRIDENIKEAKLEGELYKSLQQSDSVRYAIGAMQPIDPEYTHNTFKQGNRIRDCLRKDSDVQPCDFKYQGSVTNDTHIKAVSDIDLVVMTKRFNWVMKPLEPAHPYEGDDKADIRRLRQQCTTSVRNHFPKANVEEGSKAIAITGGSLTRDVDVVPGAWCDTAKSKAYGEDYRGICLVDMGDGEYITNFPWVHNLKVADRDDNTLGGLRKSTRLMKSLKADSDKKDMLSSYDIVSIAYNMPVQSLLFPPPYELAIVQTTRDYCVSLRENDALRASIEVPNGTRKVFGSDGANCTQLINMIAELDQLIYDIASDAYRPFTKLQEARVEHRAGLRPPPSFTLLGR